MKILLTAFDAFGGEPINPALEAVMSVVPPEGVQLIRIKVPTIFGESVREVARAMEAERPDAVLCIGQAGGRSCVTPERVAINLMDASITDNAGFMPEEQPIVPGGENALFSTLPVKKIAEAIREAGVPSQVSNTAGTFVCNQLLYGVLDLCRKQYPGTRACFIHVPFLPEQVENRPGCPSMSLGNMIIALRAALKAVAAL